MRILNIIIGLLIVLVILAGMVFWYFTGLIKAPDKSNEARDVVIVIESGQGVKEIATMLEEEGVIRSARAFETYIWIEGLSAKIIAGQYSLNTGQEVSTIVSIISEGEVVASETEFQVLEGWTAADIARQYGELFSKFISNEASDLEDDFLSEVAVTDSRDIIPGQPYWFLVDKPYMANLEGYLFPDTYRVYKDATPAQIVQKMLNNFEIKLNDELKSKIEQSGLTIFETVTLASIVEKEVRTDKDRRLVADLFLRRMENGMPLQSDATVNYVTGKSELQPTIDDTKMESLYNTYLHQGLPPGPICNPSLASISAVVNPEPNDYVYYLNAPDGQTYFSKTFEGHKINKAKYL